MGWDATTIAVSADTKVFTATYDNREDTNYGTLWNISCDHDLYGGGYNQAHSFLQFDLSTIASWSHIEAATLYLYHYNTDVGGAGGSNDYPIDAHFVSDDTWDETTLTWNTPYPSWEEDVLGSVPQSMLSGLGPFGWDVKDAVVNEAPGDATLSLVLVRNDLDDWDDSPSWSYFYSKEYDTGGYAPYLAIEGDSSPSCRDDSPEPATWVLLAATAAFGALRRRRD